VLKIYLICVFVENVQLNLPTTHNSKGAFQRQDAVVLQEIIIQGILDMLIDVLPLLSENHVNHKFNSSLKLIKKISVHFVFSSTLLKQI